MGLDLKFKKVQLFPPGPKVSLQGIGAKYSKIN